MRYLLEFTPLGRRLLLCGRRRSVAQLSGLRVGRLRWDTMVASGVIAARAGVMYAGTASTRSARWWSCTSLATGITGLQQPGVDTFIQQLFSGGALVPAVALSQPTRRRQSIEFAAME